MEKRLWNFTLAIVLVCMTFNGVMPKRVYGASTDASQSKMETSEQKKETEKETADDSDQSTQVDSTTAADSKVEQTDSTTDSTTATAASTQMSKNTESLGTTETTSEEIHKKNSVSSGVKNKKENTETKNTETGKEKVAARTTIEEDGVYYITVNYVNQAGDKIFASNHTVLEGGESWSIKSPDIGGYVLSDSSKATMSGRASGTSHRLTYNVEYTGLQTVYTVIYMLQADTDVYYEVSREEKTGIAGSTVQAAAIDFMNYHCITSHLTVKVAADGRSTIKIYYDMDIPFHTIHFYTQGSYVPFISGIQGTPVITPSDPVRTGYTFAGWDINGDGHADPLPSVIPDYNINATALWTPASTNYVINYWKEDATNHGSYEIESTGSATGITNTTTPTAPKKDCSEDSTDGYKWYVYKNEEPVKIEADGSSVLNVYYELKTITVSEYVKINGTTEVLLKTFKEKYGYQEPFVDQNIVNQTYKDHGGTEVNYNGWHLGSGDNVTNAVAVKAIIRENQGIDFDTLTLNYSALYTNRNIMHYEMWRYYENLDGTYPDEKDPSLTAVLYGNYSSLGVSVADTDGFVLVSYRLAEGIYDGTNYDDLTWGDWKDIKSNEKVTIYYADNHNFMQFKYKRVKFTTHYYSEGIEVASGKHLYEDTYSPADDLKTEELTSPGEGYVFAGWYDNEELTGDPVSSELTVPLGDTNLYAKWKRKPVTLSFDSKGGTPVESQSVDWGKSGVRPEKPVKKSGAKFLGWYIFDKNGIPSLFDFEKPMEADQHLVAMWNPPTDKVGYKVIHKTKSGTILKTEQFFGNGAETYTVCALASDDQVRADYPYVDHTLKNITLSLDDSQNVVTFIYASEAAHVYTVHYVDRATGSALRADDKIGSKEALVSVDAPQIAGYTIADQHGYVSIKKSEWTFYYDAKASSITTKLPVSKVIRGDKPSVDETFSFTLTAENSASPMPKNSSHGVKTAAIKGEGNVIFGEYQYKKTGTYVYSVRETAGSNRKYTYDRTVYTVTDVVTEKSGKFNLKRTIRTKSGKTVSRCIFVNRYTKTAVTSKKKTSTDSSSGSSHAAKYEHSVETGDFYNVTVWFSVFLLTGVAAVVILLRKRKQKFK